jgi:peroxiredoxin Q/BCP
MRFTIMTRAIATFAAVLLATGFVTPVLAETPVAGDRAPDFDLTDQDGELRSLEDYRGEWVTLYFYPKDDTPGCTTQACEFRDDVFKYRQMDCQIIGVSFDDRDSHQDFAEKYSLPFPLLADTRGTTADAYGVRTRMRGTSVAKRQTFLIDPHGRIAKHYANVDPATHSAEVLGDLAKLTGKPVE